MRQAFIAMAHRGRLNVMAHVLGKPYEQILAEFKDPVVARLEIEGVKWSGDVKYHLGASRAIAGGEAVTLVVSMPPNPSHLEAIDPVLEGMARAAGTDTQPRRAGLQPRRGAADPHPRRRRLSGQGVVAETLNLHRLAGYTTGGTIHIIRTTRSASRPSRTRRKHALCERTRARIQDPDHSRQRRRSRSVHRRRPARLRVSRAVQARRADRPFGYRRYGHNEGDEPASRSP